MSFQSDLAALRTQDPAGFVAYVQRKSSAVAPGVPAGGDIGAFNSPWGNSGWPRLLPSTRIDYLSEAGDLTQNSVIMACVQWVGRTFPEAPARVMRRGTTAQAQATAIPDHPLTLLLEQPNTFYNGLLLWQATLLSYNIAGNAYWLKVRNGAQKVVELWYEPDFTIRPMWDSEGKDFITKYQVKRAGQWRDVPAENVVHFRQGLDPRNPRLGLSPLASALREVFTDNEAANFSASLLRNMGIPGVVISPAGNETTIADPEGLKQTMISKFSGDRRGEPLVMQGPTKIELLSFSPQQMNYESLRNIPEERISALLGIPAMVAGLGAGLERSTFTNYENALQAAYHNNILPTHRLISAQLKTSLLPDLGDAQRESVEFDTSKVQALQEDRNDLYKRVNTVWASGLIKRSEGRLALDASYTTTPADEIYRTDLISRAERITEVEPAGTLIPDLGQEGEPVGTGKARTAGEPPTITEIVPAVPELEAKTNDA